MQPIWDAIIQFDPQVFIWLGDNIYGDIKHPFQLFGEERTVGPWKNVPRFVPSSEQEMESRYERAKTNPGYSRLRQNAKVLSFESFISRVNTPAGSAKVLRNWSYPCV